MLYALDLIGTFVFALSGAFKGRKHELDWLGVTVLAVLTGVGGGLMRDMLLGDTPAAAFRDEWYLVACLLGAGVVIVAAPGVAKRWNRVMIADAVGLGLFAALGAAKAAEHGLGPIGVVMMAALTATGGGVIRDALVRELPAILHKGFYATAALIGGIVFLGLNALDVSEPFALGAAAIVCSALRFYALVKNVNLPKAERLNQAPAELSNQPPEK